MVNIILGFLLCLVIVLIFIIFVVVRTVSVRERTKEITDEQEVADTLISEWLNLQFEDETEEESEERKFAVLLEEAAKLRAKIEIKNKYGESL